MKRKSLLDKIGRAAKGLFLISIKLMFSLHKRMNRLVKFPRCTKMNKRVLIVALENF